MNCFAPQIMRTGTKNKRSVTNVSADHLSVFLAGRITAERARFSQQSENPRLSFHLKRGRVFSTDAVENG